MAGNDPVWTADEVAMLRRMWADGYRVVQIAERMGRSKKAIWRKRKVVGLSPRYETQPAPVVPAPPAPPRPVGKGRTLPPLPSLAGMEDTP